MSLHRILFGILLPRSTLDIEPVADFVVHDATLRRSQLLTQLSPLDVLLHQRCVLFADIDFVTAVGVLDDLLEEALQALLLDHYSIVAVTVTGLGLTVGALCLALIIGRLQLGRYHVNSSRLLLFQLLVLFALALVVLLFELLLPGLDSLDRVAD